MKDNSKLKSLQFSILSSDEIKKRSVSNIINYKLLDDNNNFIKNSLYDNNLEDIGENKPGNFGNIELSEYIYNISFLETIFKILKITCYNCSSLIIEKTNNNIKNILRLKKGKRLSYITKETSKYSRCSKCNFVKVKYLLKNYSKFYVDIKNEIKYLNNENIYKILQKITKYDLQLIGLNYNYCQPQNFLLKNIPVAPTSIRPYLKLNYIFHNDITYKYQDILKTNDFISYLVDNENIDNNDISDLTGFLQYNANVMINNSYKYENDIVGLSKSGQVFKSLKDRLSGKEGLIRSNLMGKRVNYSGRAVITGDSTIKVNEIGLPYSIVMKLTKPVLVTEKNYPEILKLVKNGQNVYPGANYIIRNKKTMPVTNENSLIKVGDIVRRHLNETDYIILNRQPTLHKLSMMAHKVKPIKGSTFRINLSITELYNADFDGDEMNIHLPQDILSDIEMKELMNVNNNVINSQGLPMINLIQDSIIGLTLLSKKNIYFTKTEFLSFLPNKIIQDENFEIPIPSIMFPEELWSSKQLISIFLPDINVENSSKIYNILDEDIYFQENDSFILIKNGNLISGTFDKKFVNNKIVRNILDNYNYDELIKFIENFQFIINNFVTNFSSFTIGYGDFVISDKIKENMNDLIDNKYNILTNSINANNIAENEINSKLGDILVETSKYTLDKLDYNNNMKMILLSGSKGKTANIGQTMICLGQQSLNGNRIPLKFGGDRTLPHYLKNNKTNFESRGFIRNSFIDGINPKQFFFHLMSGRENIIDTAIKTADSGYLQRKLVKALEDIIVKYDDTVRNSNNDIIQFKYAGNSYKIETLQNINLDLLNKNIEDIKLNYYIFSNSKINLLELVSNFKNNSYYDKNNIELPFNIKTIIQNLKSDNTTKLNTSDIGINLLNLFEFIDNLNPTNHIKYIDDKFIDKIVNNNSLVIKLYICSYLLKKEFLSNISQDIFIKIIEKIKEKLEKSFIEAGSAIGVISAQYIGEPLTQMTLRTFHFAGISSANVTLGIPRINEILNINKRLKNPKTFIFLKNNKDLNDIYEKVDYINLAEIIDNIKFNILENNEISLFIKIKNNKLLYFKNYNEKIYNAISEILNDNKNILNNEIYFVDNENYDININIKIYEKIKNIEKLILNIKKNFQKLVLSGIYGLKIDTKVDLNEINFEEFPGGLLLNKVKNVSNNSINKCIMN